MVRVTKSQPAPASLILVASKRSGSYRTPEVLARNKQDFRNKCYLCEQSQITDINTEHFVSHKGDSILKFSWDNLFCSCSFCNNVKGQFKKPILNCTDQQHDVETSIRYTIKKFPINNLVVDAVEENELADNTVELLTLIFYRTSNTGLHNAQNLRDRITYEVSLFESLIDDYNGFKSNGLLAKQAHFKRLIIRQLDRSSQFTAFKQWVVRDNAALMQEFGQYLEYP